MAIRLLTDEDVAKVDMAFAVECMEEALQLHAAGELVAPGRIASDVEIGQLVFTTGAVKAAEPVVGFRCYDLTQLHSADRTELTVVADAGDGHLHGLVVGPLLGAVRTGAIGGVAIKYLAPADAVSLAVIGTGYQARTQLAAALAVRDFETIRVFSRDEHSCRDFAQEMGAKLGRTISVVDLAQGAVEDADVVICATTSSTPVIKQEWLKPCVHINNIGPKFKDSHELDIDIYQNADRVVTDAPAQIEAYGDAFVLHGDSRQIADLSGLVVRSGGSRGSTPATPHAGLDDDEPATVNGIDEATDNEGSSLFISLGLAGTEVLLAKALLS